MTPELHKQILKDIDGPEEGYYKTLKTQVEHAKAENWQLFDLIDVGGLITTTLKNLEKTVDHFGIADEEDRNLCCETIMRLQRLKANERPDYFNKVEDENLKKLLAMLDHFRLLMRAYVKDLEKHATPEQKESFSKLLNKVCPTDGNQKI